MYEMAASDSTEQKLLDFRIEMYLSMRFTHKEAVLLANSKGDDGFPLNYRKVKRALDEGCGHKLAVRIFENVPFIREDDDEDEQEEAA